ncbi:hypothetical protein EV421DRAFT_664304 [Armillaria borealis]|uniref:Fungal-type protein kinase domain-containing protein n=1 Tax=Armillaria borealis TaxID=47425 RepID=A0AA39N034_9AGAR|nr:hypothetical protein EV421DRAFT_664304 [Armillaria borealis]
MGFSASDVVHTDSDEDTVLAPDSPSSAHRPSRFSMSLYKTSVLSHTAAPVGGAITGGHQPYTAPERLYTSRKHVRVLFSEVDMPLNKVDDLGKMFGALLQAFKELRYLYRSGHVHGDISPGNILLYSNNQAKISDLDVKPFSSKELKSDLKTVFFCCMIVLIIPHIVAGDSDFYGH